MADRTGRPIMTMNKKIAERLWKILIGIVAASMILFLIAPLIGYF